jgi:hypothetical protein
MCSTLTDCIETCNYFNTKHADFYNYPYAIIDAILRARCINVAEYSTIHENIRIIVTHDIDRNALPYWYREAYIRRRHSNKAGNIDLAV